MWNFVVPSGDRSLDDSVAGTERGAILSRFSGGNPNSNLEFSGVAKNSFYEPSRRDALAISQEHEDIGRPAGAGELDRKSSQERGFQLEVGDDFDAGELGEIRQ